MTGRLLEDLRAVRSDVASARALMPAGSLASPRLAAGLDTLDQLIAELEDERATIDSGGHASRPGRRPA